MNLPEKTHDIVICSHVLEHYEDPKPYIEKLKRIAKRFVICMTPFNEALGVYKDHKICVSEEYVRSLNPYCYDIARLSKSICFVLKSS